MRPGEFEQMDAGLWNQAMTDRVAYRKGVEQARSEAAGEGKLTAMLAAKNGKPVA